MFFWYISLNSKLYPLHFTFLHSYLASPFSTFRLFVCDLYIAGMRERARVQLLQWCDFLCYGFWSAYSLAWSMQEKSWATKHKFEVIANNTRTATERERERKKGTKLDKWNSWRDMNKTNINRGKLLQTHQPIQWNLLHFYWMDGLHVSNEAFL